MDFVVYGQKETLFKRRHTHFQSEGTISLRLACRRSNENVFS